MTNWTDTLTRKQVHAVRRALNAELSIADHVQSQRSNVDGWATVEVFVGRRVYTVTLGSRGGIKSQYSDIVS